LLLAACGTPPPPVASKPADVIPIAGTELNKVVLTADAALRIGIKTAPVELRGSGTTAARLTVPLSAVVYDPNGVTWVYTQVDTLTYVRERVTIAGVEGEDAVLGAGPTPGVKVVIVGAAELLGSEYGVEGE
jgi:hypothetical protein